MAWLGEPAFFGRPRGGTDRMVPAGVKALLSTVTTSQTRLQHPTRVPSVTINSASATTMDEPLFELPNFRRGSDADITIREVSPMHASSDSTETDALHPHSKDSFDVLWKTPSEDGERESVLALQTPALATPAGSDGPPMQFIVEGNDFAGPNAYLCAKPLLELTRTSHLTPVALRSDGVPTAVLVNDRQSNSETHGSTAVQALKEKSWRNTHAQQSQPLAEDRAGIRVSDSTSQTTTGVPQISHVPRPAADVLRSTMPATLSGLLAVPKASDAHCNTMAGVHETRVGGPLPSVRLAGLRSTLPTSVQSRDDPLLDSIHAVLSNSPINSGTHIWPTDVATRMPRRKPVRATQTT